MITISRKKKEFLDDFGSYKVDYDLNNSIKEKSFEVIYNAIDEDFLFDSDFYQIKTGNKDFFWKKKNSKFRGFVNKELSRINGIKELLRYLFVNEDEIFIKTSIFDNEFDVDEFKLFCKRNELNYNRSECYELWYNFSFLLLNKQIDIEDKIKSIDRSLIKVKNKEYKNKLLLERYYLEEWNKRNDNQTISY